MLGFPLSIIAADHERQLEDKIAAAFKRNNITGTAAELICTWIYARVQRHSETGELGLALEHAHLAEDQRSGWVTHEWAMGAPRWVPLDEALRLVFDASGPVATLARRQRLLRVEQWRSEAEADRHRREMHERNARMTQEQARTDAWQALPCEARALVRIGNAPMTGDAFAAALAQESSAEDSQPPAGWTPAPPAPTKKKSFLADWPNLTFDPSKPAEESKKTVSISGAGKFTVWTDDGRDDGAADDDDAPTATRTF